MRALLLLLCLLWCISAQATTLTDASTFANPIVVDDWSALNYANGEDGPIYIQGLRIESLNNSPEYNEIGHYLADPTTGFPDDADGYVSALNANLLQTDFLFTFPREVKRAGLYLRAYGDFKVQALDGSRNILASDRVTLTYQSLVAFRGFADLPGFRSIRVTEIHADYYSTQFDEVQWQLVPEPSAFAILGIGFWTSLIAFCGRGVGRNTNLSSH